MEELSVWGDDVILQQQTFPPVTTTDWCVTKTVPLSWENSFYTDLYCRFTSQLPGASPQPPSPPPSLPPTTTVSMTITEFFILLKCLSWILGKSVFFFLFVVVVVLFFFNNTNTIQCLVHQCEINQLQAAGTSQGLNRGTVHKTVISYRSPLNICALQPLGCGPELTSVFLWVCHYPVTLTDRAFHFGHIDSLSLQGRF